MLSIYVILFILGCLGDYFIQSLTLFHAKAVCIDNVENECYQVEHLNSP